MSETKTNRTRLARSSMARVFQKGSLWASEDHLLVVHNSGYTERYRRIYFKDLQAILVTDSPRRLVWAVVLPLPAVSMLAVAIAVDGTFWRGVWLAISLFFWLLAAINWLRGPTVKCHAQTPVQQVRLGALSRQPRVDRFLAELAPRVEAVQGRLEPTEAVAGLASGPQAISGGSVQSLNRPRRVPPSPAVERRPASDDGRWQRAAFITLFAFGWALAVSFVWTHPVLLSLQILLVAAGGTLSIMALARGRDGGVPETLSFLTKISVGYVIALCGLVFVYYMVMVFTNPEHVDDPLYFYRILVSWRPGTDMMITLLYLVASAGALLTGGLGWWQSAGTPRAALPVMPPPPPPAPPKPGEGSGSETP